MTPQNELILSQLSAKLIAALDALTIARDKVTKLDAQKLEYERQIKVHQQAGNEQDAVNVSVLLTQTYSLLEAAQKELKLKQIDYETALANYNTAKDTILTQEEKDEIKINAVSNANIAQAEAQIKIEEAKNETTKSQINYASQNAKYIFMGVAGLLIVIVIGLAYVSVSKSST